jgi:hypothetical protein
MPRDGSGRSHNAVEEDPAFNHDIAHGVGKDPKVSPTFIKATPHNEISEHVANKESRVTRWLAQTRQRPCPNPRRARPSKA